MNRCTDKKPCLTNLVMFIKVFKNPFFLFILILSYQLETVVFAQSSEERAVAGPGDGIHTLLQKHGLNPDLYMARFIELNQDIIGENNILFEGTAYTLPAVSPEAPDVVNYPVFGDEYANITIRDQRLSGAVYYLLAGHGGPDPGAVTSYGRYTISEDEYAYDVTLRLARGLIEHGAQVYMIIKSDDGIRDQSILAMSQDEKAYPDRTIPANHTLRLKQRTDAVNNLYAEHRGAFQRMIAIHIDSRSRGENIDVFFYHHRRSRNGERLANHIHQTFINKYALHQPGRRYDGNVIQRSGLYVIRNTTPPAVFIELGNIRNSRDRPRFILYNNRQALANWITEGILADFEERRP